MSSEQFNKLMSLKVSGKVPEELKPAFRVFLDSKPEWFRKGLRSMRCDE